MPRGGRLEQPLTMISTGLTGVGGIGAIVTVNYDTEDASTCKRVHDPVKP